MKAYKWMTKDMQAFYDGFRFVFGWNAQEGVKDGTVCRDGGFHITKDPDMIWSAPRSKYPHHNLPAVCYEVYYRKKDILGEGSGEKLRVRAFKILKKKPLCDSILNTVCGWRQGTPTTSSSDYTCTTASTSANNSTASSNGTWATWSYR